VLLYGASDNDQLRAFGIYYPIVLVPFLTMAAVSGARTLALSWRRLPRPEVLAASIVTVGALLVFGSRAGYVLRPWNPDVAALPGVLESLQQERLILVDSNLYPHAGYATRIQLLTPETLRAEASAGAAIVLTMRRDAYPFTPEALEQVRQLPAVIEAKGTLIVRRNTGAVKATSERQGFPHGAHSGAAQPGFGAAPAPSASTALSGPSIEPRASRGGTGS
jgi:hypothetical protein